MSVDHPVVVFGVTAPVSLMLMRGLPERMVAEGWHVHVVAGPGQQLAAAGQLPGVTAHVIPMRRDPAPFADLVSLWRWARLLRRISPDLVSAGTPKAGLLAMVAARLTGVHVRVYVLRGLRLETTEGLRRRVYATLERVACRCAGTVLAVSDSLRRRAVELQLAPPDKIVVLGRGSSNGVAVGAPRAAPGVRASPPTVTFVGRLSQDKGVGDLVAALDLLAQEGRSVDVRLVGADEGELGSRAVEQLRAQGHTVQWSGHVDDMDAVYAQAAVLALPTYREGFPNVVLEAGVHGVPTVTTRATGAVDAVVHGETGLVVDVGDHVGLARALATLLDDDLLRVELGRGARQMVERDFDRESVQQAQIAFYDRLLGRRVSS